MISACTYSSESEVDWHLSTWKAEEDGYCLRRDKTKAALSIVSTSNRRGVRPDDRTNRFDCHYKMPGMTAFRFPTLSFPNFSTYHRLPCNALGNMVEISLSKKLLAGTQSHPPTIQNPAHSNHSQK